MDYSYFQAGQGKEIICPDNPEKPQRYKKHVAASSWE